MNFRTSLLVVLSWIWVTQRSLSAAVKAAPSLALQLAALLLIALFVLEVSYNILQSPLAITISSVPSSLNEAGLTTEVATTRLNAFAAALFERASSNSSTSKCSVTRVDDRFSSGPSFSTDDDAKERWPDLPNMEVQLFGTGIPIQAIAARLKRFLGIRDRRLIGEITQVDGQYYLDLRETGREHAVHVGPQNLANIDEALRKAARESLQELAPFSLIEALCVDDPEGAIEVAQSVTTRATATAEEKALAFNAAALLVMDRPDTPSYELASVLLQHAIDQAPEIAALHFNRGYALAEINEFVEAAAARLRAAELRPNDAEMNLGACVASVRLLVKGNQAQQADGLRTADRYCSRSLPLSRVTGDLRMISQSYAFVGFVRLRQGRSNEAVINLTNAVNHDPKNKNAQNLLETARRQLGAPATAQP